MNNFKGRNYKEHPLSGLIRIEMKTVTGLLRHTLCWDQLSHVMAVSITSRMSVFPVIPVSGLHQRLLVITFSL